MATREELMGALRRAHDAGDTEVANEIAKRIRGLGAAPAAPTATNAPQAPAVPQVITPQRPMEAPNPASDFGGGTLQFGPMDTGIPIGENVQNVLAGAGQSFVKTGDALRQLYNRATGDDTELTQLQAAEEERRKRDEALGETWAGTAGQIAGDVAVTALPAAGNVGKLAQVAKAAPILTGAGVGGLQALLEPTTSGAELAGNVGIGTVAGGALSAVPVVGSKVVKSIFGKTPEQIKADLITSLRNSGVGKRTIDAAKSIKDTLLEKEGLRREAYEAAKASAEGVGEVRLSKTSTALRKAADMDALGEVVGTKVPGKAAKAAGRTVVEEGAGEVPMRRVMRPGGVMEEVPGKALPGDQVAAKISTSEARDMYREANASYRKAKYAYERNPSPEAKREMSLAAKLRGSLDKDIQDALPPEQYAILKKADADYAAGAPHPKSTLAKVLREGTTTDPIEAITRIGGGRGGQIDELVGAGASKQDFREMLANRIEQSPTVQNFGSTGEALMSPAERELYLKAQFRPEVRRVSLGVGPMRMPFEYTSGGKQVVGKKTQSLINFLRGTGPVTSAAYSDVYSED